MASTTNGTSNGISPPIEDYRQSERRTIQMLKGARSFADVMRITLSYLNKRWGFEGLGVQLIDPTEEMLLSFRLVCVTAYAHLEFSQSGQKIRLREGNSRSANVLASGQRYYAQVKDLDTHSFVSDADRAVTRQLNIKDNLVLPVFSEGEPCAVVHMSAYSKNLDLSEQALDDIDVFFASIYGYIVAAQKSHQLKRIYRQSDSAMALAAQLSRTGELKDLLKILGLRISRWSTLDGYSVNLKDKETGDLVIRDLRLPVGYEAAQKTYTGYVIHGNEDDPNNQVMRERGSLVLDQSTISKYTGSSALRFERWGLSYMAILPLFDAKGRGAGTVMLFSQKEPIAAGVVSALESELTLFDSPLQNALTIDHFESQEAEIRSAVERQRRFMDFLIQLSELHDSQKLIKTFLTGILRHFPQFQVAILHLESGLKLRFTGCEVVEPQLEGVRERNHDYLSRQMFELRREDGAIPTCYLQNLVIYFEQLRDVVHLPMAKKDKDYIAAFPELQTFMQMPVRHRGQPVGVLGLGTVDHVVPEPESDQRMIELISAYMGAPLFNAAMYEKVESQNLKIEQLNRELMGQVDRLHVMASKDELTGLDNVRQLRLQLKALLPANGVRAPMPFSLVMVDIDRFKSFNDDYGHLVGDKILKLVGRRLQDAARQGDSVFRYGGEEFVILLPGADVALAHQIAQRLRKRLADEPFVLDGIHHKITASFGVAEYQIGESIDSIIGRADEALYEAKRQGRDRVGTADAISDSERVGPGSS